LAAATATIQAYIAEISGGDYAVALGSMTLVVAAFLAATAYFGPEAKGVSF
jgi:hypothetical protein